MREASLDYVFVAQNISLMFYFQKMFFEKRTTRFPCLGTSLHPCFKTRSLAKNELKYLFFFVFKFNYHEFIESWQQSVPEGMVTSSQQLAVSFRNVLTFYS